MMSSSEKQKAVGRRQKADSSSVLIRAAQFQRVFSCLLLSAFCLLAFGCRRDMQDQPKAIPYRESNFFRDGNASRQLVPGTVPRGYLRADREFYLGKKANSGQQPAPFTSQPSGGQATAPPITLPAGQTSAPNTMALYPDDVETFPISIDKAAL